MGEDEREIFIRTLSNCRARLYDDTLTCVHNRRYYDDVLADHKMSAIAFVDVKGLEAINRAYGHLAGDSVIRNVAQTIASCVGYHDLVRYSGERFFIGFRKIERTKFEAELANILEKIDDIHIARYPALRVSACAGGVYRIGKSADMIQDAEAAVKEAGKSAKKNVIFCD